jgi:hypothetical protein
MGDHWHGAIWIAAVMAAGCYESTLQDGESGDPASPDVVDAMDFILETVPEPAPEPVVDTWVEPEPEPEPENFVGDPCTSSMVCDGVPGEGRVCLTSLMGYVTFPGGYCSAVCTSDTECGPDGGCENLLGLGNYCLKRCDEVTDCRTAETYSCDVLAGAPGNFCLPPMSSPDA